MTPDAQAFWRRAQRRVEGLQTDVAAALLRAYQIIRESFTDAELAHIAKSGNLDRLFVEVLNQDVLDRAFIPYRQKLRQNIERGFRYAVPELPKAGKIDGVVSVMFDHLSPTVIDAIRGLETEAINTLQADVKEVSRAFLENGLRDGRAPIVVARELRSIIGLAPNQLDAVENFRRMLEEGDREALTRQLRDRRFDTVLRRMLGADGPGLSSAQVETMTSAYNRKFVAFNANVNAQTHTFDSYKVGQKLAWEEADEKGVIPVGFILMRQWIGKDDGRERPEHLAMNNEIVPADQPYSNGQSYAGEGDWGCRCTEKFFLRRAAA